MVRSNHYFFRQAAGLITASASEMKGHEELQLIMSTLMAQFTYKTTLLIQGIKGKINTQGELSDDKTRASLLSFMNALKAMVENFKS